VLLFVAAENLLDYDYEYRTGYPMPGISVMGGIQLTFDSKQTQG
jgi:iron complex outermembrane receptor protein